MSFGGLEAQSGMAVEGKKKKKKEEEEDGEKKKVEGRRKE